MIDAQDGAVLKLVVDGEVVASHLILCRSSDSRMSGLLGKKEIGLEEGILMVMPEGRAGKSGLWTSIHMLGMKFDIAAAWLDEKGEVVHATLAKRRRPYYASPKPAWAVIEIHPEHLDRLSLGKRLQFSVSS